jgi:polyhydroxyalkanoate synthesis regulator phasin
MADLEQRVTTLEQEMSALKTRVGANEEDVSSIPDLIKLEFRLANSQTARLSRDFADMRRDMAEVRRDMAGLQGKVEALPRAVAEMLAERRTKG